MIDVFEQLCSNIFNLCEEPNVVFNPVLNIWRKKIYYLQQ